MLQNEVYINKFWREFLKYGNPGARFWAKNQILLCKSGNWHKIWQKMIFWFQLSNCLYENPEIDKSGGIKFQIFSPAKIDRNISLYSYMEPILTQNPINAIFLFIFTPHQNFELLVPVGWRLLLLWAPYLVKCSKSSKDCLAGEKCQQKPF